MGFLDGLESMAANAMSESGNDKMKVAGGLLQSLQEHPGGLGAVMENMRANGLGEHVDAAQNGETPTVTPDQVATGLQGTGLLESVAAKAGVSPEVAQMAMTTVLPMVMAHFGQNGGQTPDMGQLGGMLTKLL